MRDPASFGPYEVLSRKAIGQGIRLEGKETGLYFDGLKVHLYALVFDRERGQKVVRLIDVPPEDIRDYVGQDDQTWAESIGRQSLPELFVAAALAV